MGRLLNFVVFVALTLLVGCCSNHVLPNTVYDSIIIELQETTLHRAQPEDLESLKHYLNRYSICRLENITIVSKPVVDTHGLTFWPRAAVSLFESSNRTLVDNDHNDRHLVIFMSYLPGSYGELDMFGIAGLQYGHNSIAIFGYNGENSRTSVLFHEVLHVLDLVDRDNREGPPVNPDRPNHCNNARCAMYWTVSGDTWLCILCRMDIYQIIR